MEYLHMIEQMSPHLYQTLKRSVELGKWPDGSPVSPQQRADALQAMIAWGAKHLPENERVGYIDKGHKSGGSCDSPADEPLSWKDPARG